MLDCYCSPSMVHHLIIIVNMIINIIIILSIVIIIIIRLDYSPIVSEIREAFSDQTVLLQQNLVAAVFLSLLVWQKVKSRPQEK